MPHKKYSLKFFIQMSLQRKTLGQLMGSFFGAGKKTSSTISADADAGDAGDDAGGESEGEGEQEGESDDDGEEKADSTETKKEAKTEKKAAAKTADTAGTVTLSLAEYNTMKADADQAKTLKASQADLKKKADAWDAHQKAVGAVTPTDDTTNEAKTGDSEENAEAREMKRLEARYKGLMPE